MARFYLGFAALFLAGCLGTPSSTVPDSAVVNIHGLVQDAAGKPLANTALSILRTGQFLDFGLDNPYPTSAATDGQGNYAFQITGKAAKTGGDAAIFTIGASYPDGSSAAIRVAPLSTDLPVPTLQAWNAAARPANDTTLTGDAPLAWESVPGGARGYTVHVSTPGSSADVWRAPGIGTALTLPQYLFANDTPYSWRVDGQSVDNFRSWTSAPQRFKAAAKAQARVLPLAGIWDDGGKAFAKAFDGDLLTQADAGEQNHAYELDLGSSQPIEHLVLYGLRRYGHLFNVLAADTRGSWTMPVASRDASTSAPDVEWLDLDLHGTHARYLRLVSVQPASPDPFDKGLGLAELRVIGP